MKVKVKSSGTVMVVAHSATAMAMGGTTVREPYLARSAGTSLSPVAERMSMVNDDAATHPHRLSGEDTTDEILLAIQRFDDLTAGWDSYDAQPPNGLAKDNLQTVMTAIARMNGLQGWQVSPSAAGGIAVLYDSGDRSAIFECLNSGACHLVLETEDRSDVFPLRLGEPRAIEELVREALAQIA